MSIRINTFPKLQLIQVFRGFAAILVLLHHVTGIYGEKTKYSYLENVFLPGWSGVDFFFCLSGFIIYYISYQDIGQPNRLKAFVINRFTRIYPMLWMITIVLILIYFFVPTFGIGYEREPMVIAKSLLLLPQEHNPILGVAWSLNYEVMFYAIFGLLIYLGKRVMAPVIIVWVTIILAGFGNFVSFDNNYLLQFLFSGHNLEFILGCVSANCVLNKRTQNSCLFIVLGVLGFVVTWTAALNGICVKSSSLSIVGYGLASMCLIIGASTIELKRAICVPRKLVFIGDASYSIYLTHAPLMSLLLKTFVALHIIGVLGYFLAATISWVVSLLFGCLVHQYIEKPVQSYLRKKLK